jgi:hypothetical protein
VDSGARAETFAVGVPAPAAVGWPPRWSGGQLQAGGTYPPPHWPSATQLDYTTKLITAALLVLALPAIVALLLTRPDALLVGLGRKHVG